MWLANACMEQKYPYLVVLPVQQWIELSHLAFVNANLLLPGNNGLPLSFFLKSLPYFWTRLRMFLHTCCSWTSSACIQSWKRNYFSRFSFIWNEVRGRIAYLVISSPLPDQYMKGPSFWMKSSRPLEPSLRNLSTSWPDLRKSASL